MMPQLREEDVVRLLSIAKNRLHPEAVVPFFWGVFFYEALMFLIPSIGIYKNPDAPPWTGFANVCVAMVVIQFLIALLFSFKSIIYRFQKVQFVLLGVVGFIMSLAMYPAFFVACAIIDEPVDLVLTGAAILCCGLLLLAWSTRHAIRRLRNGQFREGGRLLYNFQKPQGSVNKPLIYGMALFGGILARNVVVYGISEAYIPLALGTLIQYCMSLALPEFLLVAYCKFKFDDFILSRPPAATKGQQNKNKLKTQRINAFKNPVKVLKYCARWNVQGAKATVGAMIVVWTELAVILFLLIVLLYVSDAEGRAEMVPFHTFAGSSLILSYLFAIAILIPTVVVLWFVKLIFKKQS
ncbi:hypothetical protein [Cohnella fermenti]|uniref:Uncharacterized protein n=1 Tax=Cohnella fermenti TaxID=2565925 RepID=A0A4S4BHA8_9BACL|nr:hypothetical protein [Cohnella fermenti]THF73926.1 hypothetical protein E6C55_27030 [Cohnella fermenti]